MDTSFRKQSEVIALLRLPLIVLVLYVHVIPSQNQVITADLTIQNVYVLLSELISHNLGRISVPCSFLFAGYFFFRKISSMSSIVYMENIAKRFKTLLIPYLIWNVIFIAVIVFKNKLFFSLVQPADDYYEYIHQTSIYDLFWGIPLNYPLWFLRDLIMMMIISPLFYYFFKYLKIYGLLILLLLYLAGLQTGISGLSSSAIFFFGAGSFLGLFNYNMLELSLRYGKFCLIFGLLFLALATYSTAQPQNAYWIKLYAVFTTASVLYLGHKISLKNSLSQNLLQLSQTAFFIYAAHSIYIINWVNSAFLKASAFLPDSFLIIGYLFKPFACLSIILTCYYIMNKLIPKTLYFITGNRAK